MTSDVVVAVLLLLVVGVQFAADDYRYRRGYRQACADAEAAAERETT